MIFTSHSEDWIFFQEALEFGPESEYRKREEAVQATLRTMKELAKKAAIGQGTQTYVKIMETVTICIGPGV